jgi:hypothetical protein
MPFSTELVLFEINWSSLFVLLFILVPVVILVKSAKTENSIFSKEPSIFIALFLLYLTTFLGKPRGAQELAQVPVDEVRLLRISVIAGLVLIIGLSQLIKKNIFTIPFKGPFGAMIIYSLIAMASAIYSPMPLLSVWKGFEVFAFTFVFCHLLEKTKSVDDLKCIVNLNWLILFLILSTAYLGALISPQKAFEEVSGTWLPYQLTGLWPRINPNSLAEISAVLSVVVLSRILGKATSFRSVAFYGSVLFLTFTTLVLAQSRTSFLAFGLAAFLLLLFHRRLFISFFVLVLVSALILVPSATGVLTTYVLRGQGQELFYSMSGRLYLWPLIFRIFMESPFLGYGFYAGQRMAFSQMLKRHSGISFSTFDNTYLDVLFGIGIIGMIPLLSVLAVTWTKLLVTLRPHYFIESVKNSWRILRIELIAVFFVIMARSFTGPSFHCLHINLPILLTLILSTEFMSRMKMASGR